SRAMRRALAARRPARLRRLPAIAAVLLAVALAAKVELLLADAHSGWPACYHPVDAPQRASGCERSFSNPFFHGSATRFDRDLDFGRAGSPGPSPVLSGSDWNLAFFNSLRWNVAEPADLREHIPFSVTWADEAAVTPGGALRVSYVGEGTIRVGSRIDRLPAAYAEERTVTLTGFPPRGRAVINFTFRPSATSSATRGPYATFKLAGIDTRGPPVAQEIARWLVDAPLLALTLALLFAYARLATARDWPWLVVLGLVLMLVPPFGDSQTPAHATLALIVVALAIAVRPSRRALFYAAGLVLLVNVLRVAHDYGSWDVVVYRTAGNDFLSYESFAHDFLETWSLRGSEDVFYGQPFSRYILFGVRLLLGDGDPPLAVVARAAPSLGMLAAVWIVCRQAVAQPLVRAAAVAAAACVLIVLNANTELIQLLDAGLSEWPAWAGIPVAAAALILARDRRWVLAATALLGVCVITRTNLSLALTLVAAVGLLRWARRDRRWAIACAAVYVAVVLLPLTHNLVYGHRAVLFTNSTAANTDLRLSKIPDALSHTDVRRLLEHQVRGVAYAAPEASSSALRVAIRLLQVAWVLAVVAAVVRWRATSLTTKALLVSPVLVLGPYVTYKVFNYYPRHIVAGYVLMATVLALAPALELGRRRRAPDAPRGDGSPEEVPLATPAPS
ncbi:MAG: hypothetical protein QOJ12_1776, partial [Thermoleophilales bacterium]|nr:hypothetical protein [Thermoleophilales bacterium]